MQSIGFDVWAFEIHLYMLRSPWFQGLAPDGNEIESESPLEYHP